VASRPPFATAAKACAAPPLAAFATPTPPVSANPLGPVRIVIVEHFYRTHGADPVGAGRARRRDHPGATHGGGPGQQRTHLRDVAVAHPAQQLGGPPEAAASNRVCG